MSNELNIPISAVADMLYRVRNVLAKQANVYTADEAPPNKPKPAATENNNVSLDDTDAAKAIKTITSALGEPTRAFTSDGSQAKGDDGSLVKIDRESEAAPSAVSVKAHSATNREDKLIDIIFKMANAGSCGCKRRFDGSGMGIGNIGTTRQPKKKNKKSDKAKVLKKAEAYIKWSRVLSTNARKHIKQKNFAIPSKAKGKGEKAESGNYPIPDISHARNALARVSHFGNSAEKAQVRKKVYAKYPGLKKNKEEKSAVYAKLARILSTKAREHISKKDFAIPSKAEGKKEKAESGNYPIPDIVHARNALARVSQFGNSSEKAQVRKKVYSKYPELKKNESSK